MSRLRRGLPLAVMLAASIVAAGCSPSGEAAPPTRTSSATRTADPSTSRPTAAPPIARMLDLTPYRSRPCDLLKPDQQGSFDRQGLPNLNLVAFCTWTRDQTRSELKVLLAIDADRLGELFRRSNERTWLIFERRTVRGQPAVVFSDSPNPRYCDVVVGTGTKDSIEVHQDSGIVDEDSCAKAVEWAERVIHNLEG